MPADSSDGPDSDSPLLQVLLEWMLAHRRWRSAWLSSVAGAARPRS